MRFFLIAFSLAAATTAGAQVAINNTNAAPDPSAQLDVSSSSKGVLVPRMTETERGAIAAPAKALLVYQTDGTAGFYFNSGTPATPAWTFINPAGPVTLTSATFNPNGTLSLSDDRPGVTSTDKAAWLAGGNSLTATATLGTLSNNHIDLVSSGQVRGRLSSLGELFIGTTSTALSGDLVNSVGNATFPWALNGYSSFNGGAVFGGIMGSNTTTYAGVQGENLSSTGSINSAGVRGSNSSIVPGNGYRSLFSTGPRSGVVGRVDGAGAYSFGVHGSSPSQTARSGALFGDDGGWAMGAVGYYASTEVDYPFYGFGNNFNAGAPSGRLARGTGTSAPSTHIGIGVVGGVMGGWIRGSVYGAHVLGERYSLYVDGDAYTNKPLTQLVPTTGGDRIPTYAASSMSPEVTARGKALLKPGGVFVPFTDAFRAAISSDPESLTITVTPNAESNGLYISAYDATGFWVKENRGGEGEVPFSWIAVGARVDADKTVHPGEVLAAGFDETMRGVMHDEGRPAAGTPIWWDGTRVRHDAPPAHKPDPKVFTGARTSATTKQ